MDALQQWWQLPDAARLGLDDLSLYTAESALAIHETSAAVLASRLDAYTPQFQLETAPYRRIQQVLRAARDPLPREGMTTSLVFVTPFVRGPELEDLEAAITEARELNVTVYTLLLADPDELENPLLPNEPSSEETGGQLFLFDPDEGLGNLARRIISEQSQYVVRYTSKANTSGEHSITLLAQSAGAAGNSSPLSFLWTFSLRPSHLNGCLETSSAGQKIRHNRLRKYLQPVRAFAFPSVFLIISPESWSPHHCGLTESRW